MKRIDCIDIYRSCAHSQIGLFLMGTDYAGCLVSARASVKSLRRCSTSIKRFFSSAALCIYRLDASPFATHLPKGEVHQALRIDIGIVELAVVAGTDGRERSLCSFAQRPRFFDFAQVLINHLFGGSALAARPLDRTRLIKFRFTLTRPRLRSLFPGEGLTLLVDLHPITFDADLSGVAHRPIRQFSCPDSCHIESGTRRF